MIFVLLYMFYSLFFGSRKQCWLNCIESQAYNYRCRLPGVRSDTAYPPRSPPKPCESVEDYLAQWDVLLASEKPTLTRGNLTRIVPDTYQRWNQSQAAFKRCQSECWNPCSTIDYQYVVSEQVIQKAFAVTNPTERLIAEFRLMFASPVVKVTQQQPAYDVHQLIGELGGSWGLFLGLSLANIIDYLR